MASNEEVFSSHWPLGMSVGDLVITFKEVQQTFRGGPAQISILLFVTRVPVLPSREVPLPVKISSHASNSSSQRYNERKIALLNMDEMRI